MNDYDQKTIPALIDVLTNYLKTLTDKISSFGPILDNIQTTMSKNTDDVHDVKMQLNNLKEVFESIKDLVKENEQLKSIADSLNKKLDENIKTSQEIHKKVSPVAKFASLLSTPAGLAVFVVATIGAILGIIKLLISFGLL